MKYYSEKLDELFDSEAELLRVEREAENEEKADELYDAIDDILGFACAYMAFAMQKARDALVLTAKIEDMYGVEYKFNRDVIGDIAEKYIVDMCRCTEESNAYAEQCLEAWDEAWNGVNDSCVCCGGSDCDQDCDCEECDVHSEKSCAQYCSVNEFRPFYSINIRNPIFQNFIHEYRNTPFWKKLAEEFPSIAEMFDRLESGND